jgi:hypothetical protein
MIALSGLALAFGVSIQEKKPEKPTTPPPLERVGCIDQAGRIMIQEMIAKRIFVPQQRLFKKKLVVRETIGTEAHEKVVVVCWRGGLQNVVKQCIS